MELQSTQLNINSEASLGSASQQGIYLGSSNKVGAKELSESAEELQRKSQDFLQSRSTGPVEQLAVGSEKAVAVYDRVNTASQVDRSRNNEARAVSKESAKLDVEQAELQVARELAARDREVKNHEQTHAAIGGSYTSAPRYNYTNGPDGRLYATSGEVSIDTSAVENDPRATIEKAQVIIRAALSVSDPSAADRQAAAQAKSLALQAQSELLQEAAPVVDPRQELGRVLADEQFKQDESLQARQDLAQQREEAVQNKEQASLDKEAQRQRGEASIEVLREYNVKVSEIQETLRRLNLQLVDSGAFNKLFPEGFLIDKTV